MLLLFGHTQLPGPVFLFVLKFSSRLRPAMVLEDSCFAVVEQAVVAHPAGQCCEDCLVRLRLCLHAAIELSEKNTIVKATLAYSKC